MKILLAAWKLGARIRNTVKVSKTRILKQYELLRML